MTTTSDLRDFGSRELHMGAALLQAYCNNIPDWMSDGVHLMMNRYSGYVFLTDDDFNVAMMNGDKLDAWLFTPYDGHEGFIEELTEEYKPNQLHSDDVDFIRHWSELLNFDLPLTWQQSEEEEG